MKRVLLFLIIILLCGASDFVHASCFIAVENDKIIQQEGDCKTRESPCSTFKVAISLMGFDAGILEDQNYPKLSYQKGYVLWKAIWKQDHTPALWIKHGCLWYSQFITQKFRYA